MQEWHVPIFSEDGAGQAKELKRAAGFCENSMQRRQTLQKPGKTKGTPVGAASCTRASAACRLAVALTTGSGSIHIQVALPTSTRTAVATAAEEAACNNKTTQPQRASSWHRPAGPPRKERRGRSLRASMLLCTANRCVVALQPRSDVSLVSHWPKGFASSGLRLFRLCSCGYCISPCSAT